MIEAEDEYVEYFKFQATESTSKLKIAGEYTQAKDREIDDEHKQIIGVELEKDVCLYLYQKGDEFIWIGTTESEEFNIMDPACSFSDNQPKYSFEVLESSLEYILVIANEASTDIGVIAFSKADKTWKSWSLNEGAGIVLPIIDGQDTFPKSIWLSFDSTESIPGITQDSPKIPPSPILHIELNTGGLLVYYCIRTDINADDLYFSRMGQGKSMIKDETKEEKSTTDESGKGIKNIPVVPDEDTGSKDKEKSAVFEIAAKTTEEKLENTGTTSVPKPATGFSFGAFANTAEKGGSSETSSIPKPTTGFSFGAFGNKTDSALNPFGSPSGVLKKAEDASGTPKPATGFSFGAASAKPTAFGFGSNQPSPFGKPKEIDADNPFAPSVKAKNGSSLTFASEVNNPFAITSRPNNEKTESFKSAFPPSVHSSIAQDESESEGSDTKSALAEEPKFDTTTPSPKATRSVIPGELPKDKSVPPTFSFANSTLAAVKSEEQKADNIAPTNLLFGKPVNTPIPVELKVDKKSAFLFGPTEPKKDIPQKSGFGFPQPGAAKVGNSSFTSPFSTSEKVEATGFKPPFNFGEPKAAVESKAGLFSKPATLAPSTNVSESKPSPVFAQPSKLTETPEKTVIVEKQKPDASSKPSSTVKSIEDKNQILVNKFDEYYLDLTEDMKTISSVFETVKNEISKAGTPKTLQNPTLGDLSKVQVQIMKLHESHHVQNKAREKIYETTMKLKHAGELLSAKQEEIETRIETLNKGRDLSSHLQSRFGRKLSPEAEMLQEQLAFKQNLIENDLELALKIADDLKSNKTRTNNFTLLKIANTTSQIRRSIAAIQRDLDITEATLNMLSLDLGEESPKKSPAKPTVLAKKSFSFGLDEEDLIADDAADVAQDLDALAIDKAKKELLQKFSKRPAVVKKIKSTDHQPVYRPKSARREKVMNDDYANSEEEFVQVENTASATEEFESVSPDRDEHPVEEEFEEFLSQGSASPIERFAEATPSALDGTEANEGKSVSSPPIASFNASASQSFFTQATKPLESATPFSLPSSKTIVPELKAPFSVATPNASPAVTAESKPFSFTNLSSEKKDIPTFSFTPEKSTTQGFTFAQPSTTKSAFSFTPSKLPSNAKVSPKLSEAKPFFSSNVVDPSKSAAKDKPIFGFGTPVKKLAEDDSKTTQDAQKETILSSAESPIKALPGVTQPHSPLKNVVASPDQESVTNSKDRDSLKPKLIEKVVGPSSPLKSPAKTELQVANEPPSFAEDPTFSVGELGLTGISEIEKPENVTPVSKSPVLQSSVPAINLSDNEEMNRNENDEDKNSEAMEEEKPDEVPVPSFSGFGGFLSTPSKDINPMFGVPPSSASTKTSSAFGTSGSFGQSKGAFGQPQNTTFGAQNTSVFGEQTSATSNFVQSASATSPFGSPSTQAKPTSFGGNTFGQSAFSSPQKTPAFGQSGFGSSPAAAQPAFGQSGFGSSSSNQPAFGQPAFSAAATSQPAFGQSGFGTSAVAQPAFGQSGFGQSQSTPFAAIPTTSSGFAGFASKSTNQPTSFAAVAQNAGNAPAYASGKSSAFGSSQSAFGQSTDQKPAFGSGQSTFGQSTGQSTFGQSSAQSAFGHSAAGQQQSQGTFGSGGTFGQQQTQSAFGSGYTFGNSSFGSQNTNTNK